MSCAICEKRKEKRFCPAIHGRICPQCCGEQREITLDCPSDCIYLQQARAHERPRPAEDIERETLFLQVEIGDQFIYEQEQMLLGISFALAKSGKADLAIKDRDLIAALMSIARHYETLVNSGLHYEAPMPSLAQQAVVGEVRTMIKEYREAEQKHVGYVRLRDGDVLRALVFLLRLAVQRTSGRPKSRAFVDFLLAQFPEGDVTAPRAQQAASRLIIP